MLFIHVKGLIPTEINKVICLLTTERKQKEKAVGQKRPRLLLYVTVYEAPPTGESSVQVTR